MFIIPYIYNQGTGHFTIFHHGAQLKNSLKETTKMIIFQNLSYFQNAFQFGFFIYIINLMGKKTIKRNGIHRFYLKPILDSCYFRKEIYVDFCYRKNSENCCCSQIEGNSNYVVFNKDKNYATPSFILNFDQQYYFNFYWALKNEHDKKLITMENSQQQAAVTKFVIKEFPNPQSQKKKCHVCSCIYLDYFQHIYSKSHKNKIEQSSFNNDITSLQKVFREANKLNQIQIQKRNQNTTYSSQDQNSLQSRQNNIKNKMRAQSRQNKLDQINRELNLINNDCSIQEPSKIGLHNQNIFQTQQFNSMIVNMSNGFRNHSLNYQNASNFYKFQQDLLVSPFLTNFQKYQLLQYFNLENAKMTSSWINFYQTNIKQQTVQQPIMKICQANNSYLKIFPIQNDILKPTIEKIQTQNQNCEQNQQQKLKILVKNMKQTNQKLRKINAQQSKKLKEFQDKRKKIKKNSKVSSCK